MSLSRKFVGISGLVLLAAVAGAGCSGEMGQATEGDPAQTSEAVCAPNQFFGSDTLKPLISATVAGNPVYAGTGSGNGEKALHGLLTSSPTGNCLLSTSPGSSAASQLSAPMSRDLSPAAGGATGCTVASSGDSLKSFRIGVDGILALTPTANSALTNVSLNDLRNAFCLTPTPPAGACTSPLTVGGTTIDKFYRRDDASGTTDTLKALLGCSALCNDSAHVVVDDNFPRTAPCAAGDTDTQCIAKLTQANTGAGSGNYVMSYAGRSALTVSPAPTGLSVSGVSPSDANIRNFSYPLSRFLYVNYNDTMLNDSTVSGPSLTNATCAEKKFLCENVLGPLTSGCSACAFVDRRSTFEGNLSAYDFLSCSTTVTPFGCNTAGLTCP
jgi:phosphate transport system substrate-binding protein